MIPFARSNLLSPRFAAALGALGLTILMVLLSAPAQGHSVLLGTTPADEEQLATAPAEVSLLFNEDITNLGTEVVVTVNDDEIVSEGEIEINGPEITQRLTDVRPKGAYTVTWRAVSADGHPISGVYVFTAAEDVGDVEGTEPADGTEPTEEPETEEAPEVVETDEPETGDADADDEEADASAGLSSSTWVVIGVLVFAVIILVTVLSRSLAGNKKD